MSKATINLTPPRGSLTVLPAWTISMMEKAKAFPGRTKFQKPTLWFELSKENINYARMSFPYATIIGDQEWEFEREIHTVARPRFNTALPMDPLQYEAFVRSEGKKAFAFFEKPGAGKTKVLLDRTVALWCEGKIDCLLIVSYAGVHEQWILDEAPKHIHSSIPWIGVARFSGKKLPPDIIAADPSVLRILAVNYESYAVSLNARRDIEAFYRSGRCAIALDESQRIMNPEALVTEQITADQSRYEYRFVASGEPTPRGIENYFSQFWFIDPTIMQVLSYSGFKARYCRMDQHRQIIGYYNQEELHRLMAPHVHIGEPYIKAKQIFEESKFSLGPQCREAYNSMRDELLVEIDDGRIATVATMLPKLIRLQQIACGRLPMNDGTVEEFDNIRVEHVKTLLNIYEGKKAVIWARFQEDHAKLNAALGERSAVINGNVKKKDRRPIIQSFIDQKGEIQYLINSAAAGGTGWNLQGACWLNIYHSSSYNAGQRWQSEKRTHRRGVEDDVLYIDVLARNTIDIGIRARHRLRRDVSDMSMAELRDLISGE